MFFHILIRLLLSVPEVYQVLVKLSGGEILSGDSYPVAARVLLYFAL